MTAPQASAPRVLSSRDRTSLSNQVRAVLRERRNTHRHIGSALAAGVVAALAPIASAGPFPPELELSSLLSIAGGDGTAGVVLSGIAKKDYSGYAARAAGDVNGDGIDDLIIGAHQYCHTCGGQSGPGEAYVVFGRESGAWPPQFDLGSLLAAQGGDGSDGFVLLGETPEDKFGFAVGAAGDVNGDGIDDLVVGAISRGLSGAAYLVFGRDAARNGFPAEFEVSSLQPANGGDGSVGVVFEVVGATGGTLGLDVNAAGDLNGDGIDDLVIGAPGTITGPGFDQVGRTYVVFGRAAPAFPALFDLGALLTGDGSAGFALTGIDDLDRSGYSVAAAGDLNGDGVDDLAIGDRQGGPGTLGPGESYVVFGRRTAQDGNFPADFQLSSLLAANGGDGSAGVVLKGNLERFDNAGRSIRGLGDLDADGIDDVIIGAPAATGGAYVVFGRTTDFPAEIDLGTLLPANGGDGSAGFALVGSQAWTGYDVATAGDLNGDGIPEAVVAAAHTRPGGRSVAGSAFVVYGRNTAQTGRFPAELPLSSLRAADGGDGSVGFVANGIGEDDQAGTAIGSAGDVNADGRDDLLIGARFVQVGRLEDAGETYLVFGRADGDPPADADHDAVPDAADLCEGTRIPEPAPIVSLRSGRYAQVDGDITFEIGDSTTDFTTVHTHGCSCAQIVNALDLGAGELLFGCKASTITRWISSPGS